MFYSMETSCMVLRKDTWTLSMTPREVMWRVHRQGLQVATLIQESLWNAPLMQEPLQNVPLIQEPLREVSLMQVVPHYRVFNRAFPLIHTLHAPANCPLHQGEG